MYDFSADSSAINKSEILKIRKYLMVKNIKCFNFKKNIFVVLLSFSRPLKLDLQLETKTKTRSVKLDLHLMI